MTLEYHSPPHARHAPTVHYPVRHHHLVHHSARQLLFRSLILIPRVRRRLPTVPTCLHPPSPTLRLPHLLEDPHIQVLLSSMAQHQLIDDFSIQPPICSDISSHAQTPLYTYHRRQVSSSSQLPRNARSRQPPAHLQDFYLHAAELQLGPHLPGSTEEALGHPGWRSAMEDELSSIYKNDTWDLVSLPSDRKAISTKWVFRVKHNADGTIAKFKARLVAKGFQQREGHDYAQTFAPVVKWNTLRSIVSLAGHHGWTIVHLDVKTAFLNGDIQEDIYVKPPPGFESLTHPHYACKLKKALYGLKQAPRAWYCKVDHYFISQGPQKSSAKVRTSIFMRITAYLRYLFSTWMTST